MFQAGHAHAFSLCLALPLQLPGKQTEFIYDRFVCNSSDGKQIKVSFVVYTCFWFSYSYHPLKCKLELGRSLQGLETATKEQLEEGIPLVDSVRTLRLYL